jgi:5'-3' exonuclease
VIHIYDGNNVLLRDLERIGHERIGLRRRYEMCNDGNLHIWVFEGRNNNGRRREIYPAYKMQRTPMQEDRFAQISLFRDALEHSNAVQVCCDGWEGDDVINTLAVQFAEKGLPVTVLSNDADYFQLAHLPGITLDGVKPLDCDPQHTPLYKATVGDPADNIIGIPSFGPKTWALLSFDDREALQAAIEAQDYEAITALPLPKRILTQLANQEVLANAAAALQITKFFTVPEAELDAGITKGTLNREAADNLFRKYFL